jgi:hypothetical protein
MATLERLGCFSFTDLALEDEGNCRSVLALRKRRRQGAARTPPEGLAKRKRREATDEMERWELGGRMRQPCWFELVGLPDTTGQLDEEPCSCKSAGALTQERAAGAAHKVSGAGFQQPSSAKAGRVSPHVADALFLAAGCVGS